MRWSWLVLVAMGCSGSAPSVVDGGQLDAGRDAGELVDAGPPDAGSVCDGYCAQFATPCQRSWSCLTATSCGYVNEAEGVACTTTKGTEGVCVHSSGFCAPTCGFEGMACCSGSGLQCEVGTACLNGRCRACDGGTCP